jgi:hypothetical protein
MCPFHYTPTFLGLTQKRLSPAAAWYFIFFVGCFFAPPGRKKQPTKDENPRYA